MTDDETTDVTSEASVTPAVSIVPSNAVAVNLSVECPEGFKLNADNSCMYLGK